MTSEERYEPDVAVALYECGFSVQTIAFATGRGVKKIRRVLTEADVMMRPPGSHPHVSGAAVARLPEGAGRNIALRLLAQKNAARSQWRPWDPPDAGSWRQVLLLAIDSRETASVATTAAEHLGRPATRLELQAVRRAALRLADEGLM